MVLSCLPSCPTVGASKNIFVRHVCLPARHLLLKNNQNMWNHIAGGCWWCSARSHCSFVSFLCSGRWWGLPFWVLASGWGSVITPEPSSKWRPSTQVHSWWVSAYVTHIRVISPKKNAWRYFASDTYSITDLCLSFFFLSAVTVLIALGSVMLIVVVFGDYGACNEKRCALQVVRQFLFTQ